MNQTNILIGVLVLIIGLGIGYSAGVTQNGKPGAGMHRMADGGMMKNDQMKGNADQHFIIQMIPHHEGAIDMAKLALEKSKRPEILTLAQNIITAQEKEISEMKTWYQTWYGTIVPEGGMGMHMNSMSGDMTALRALSDSAFDREFMEQMIPHHEMALMMAQMIRSSERPEMRQLAENVVMSQSAEIDMMRGWLKQWYATQ